MHSDPSILIAAMKGLTTELHLLRRQIETAVHQVYGRPATKHDLECIGDKIMSKISEYVDRVNTSFETLGSAVDEANTSIQGVVKAQQGITADVKGLKDLIEKLQNSPGQITPEDQKLLDESEAKVNALVTRVGEQAAALKTAAASLEELDNQTESAPENPPTE